MGKMSHIIGVMNATEVIREIDRLPEEERVKVVLHVRKLSIGRRKKKTRYIPRGAFEKTANRVFEKHSELFKKLAK